MRTFLRFAELFGTVLLVILAMSLLNVFANWVVGWPK